MVTGGYKGLQGITRGYKGLQGVTRGYQGLQGVTMGYRRLQGVTSITDGYRGLQGITEGYSVTFKPKNYLEISLFAHAPTSGANILLLDQKGANCTTWKRLSCKF